MNPLARKNVVQFAISASIIAVVGLCIFTPDVFVFKKGANFSVHFMFGFLMLAMAFLVLKQEKLIFVALTASGLLAFHLKSTSDQSMRFPVENENPRVSVAHIDLSLSEDFSSALHSIWNSDVDVLSFQEYTPYWAEVLPDELEERYPYSVVMTRIDPYGKAIFSKYPICSNDTILFEDFGAIPSLLATVRIDEDTEAHVLNAHSIPPVNDEAYALIKAYLLDVGEYIGQLKGPVITLGDFSLPSWSSEIKEFKRFADLSDSRRDVIQKGSGSRIFLFDIPIDHIFYSGEIECTAFGVINNNQSHLGITGNYQLKAMAGLEKLN